MMHKFNFSLLMHQMSVINNLLSPLEIQQNIASRFKAVRLSQNMTQRALSARSGVSYGSLQRFEATGEISLKSLVQLSIALGRAGDMNALFPDPGLENLFADPPKTRKRAR